MKKNIYYLCLSVLCLSMLQACSTKKKPKVQANTSISNARQDSLAIAQAKKEATADEEKVQTKVKPSEKKSLSASTPKKSQHPQSASIVFNSDGSYAIQVSSWRSHHFAQKRKDLWIKRGYKDAYIEKYGDKKTGNIWFRVRLGRVSSRAQAQKEQKLIEQKYNSASWVSSISGMKHSK